MRTHYLTKGMRVFLCLFCASVASAQRITPQEPPLIPRQVTVWDGSHWTNGFPTTDSDVIFKADYTVQSIISAHDVSIDDGVTVTVTEGNLLKIANQPSKTTQNRINFKGGSGYLFKTLNLDNSATTLSTFTRFNKKIKQYTDILMSSPVDTQDIGNTNPTAAYAQYILTPIAVPPTSVYTSVPTSTIMTPGVGYVETVGGNGTYSDTFSWNPDISGVDPGDYLQSYTGTENSGNITTTIVADRYNLIGNPYPDYLDADTFFQNSSVAASINGPIYLWTHNTAASQQTSGTTVYNFTGNDFAMYNLLGGVSAGRDITLTAGPSFSENFKIPNGHIAFGTGFMVFGSGTGGTLTFNDGMRTTNAGLDGPQVFRPANNTALTAAPARDRIWINLAQGDASATTTSFRQTLIGYSPNATNGDSDAFYDAEPATLYDAPAISVYSFAPTLSKPLAIQGRPTFADTDEFKLGYHVTETGNYTFWGYGDNLFTPGGEHYYIKDGNAIHEFPYTFTPAAADETNNTRFKVVFAHCRITLTTIGTPVYTTYISGASYYQWTVTSGAQSISFNTSSNNFNFASTGISWPTGFVAYNKEYSIIANAVIGSAVQPSTVCIVRTNNPNTALSTCGYTLAAIGDQIHCTAIAAPANGYYWTVRNTTTNVTVTVFSGISSFSLLNTNLGWPAGFINYDTEYCIRVRPRNLDGQDDLSNGVECCVRTPIVTTHLTTCGSFTMSNWYDYIYANILSPINGYHWEVTNMSSTAIYQFNTSLRTFRMISSTTAWPSGFLQPNTTYCVRVRGLNLNEPLSTTSGFTLPYGGSCCFTTPSGTAPRTANSNTFAVQSSPNPYHNHFSLQLDSDLKGSVNIKIYDMIGKLIDNIDLSDTAVGEQSFGDRYQAGLYNVVVTQGANSQSLRVLKQ